MELVWFLLIGIVAGWLAGVLFKGSGFGLVGDMIVGVIGALLGGWLLGQLGVMPHGSFGLLVTATVGALVLLFLLSLVRRRPA
ncbi:MAG: GlsB/YeaQ/YmgE family stress response membrane protein [Planctomycetota bacterium]